MAIGVEHSASGGPPLPATIGRFDVVGIAGTGAFATVFQAHDPALDAEVAIKVLSELAAHDPDLRRRFIDEARTLRKLDHDRVVRVHDLGEYDGRPYTVMDFHGSGTLADRLASDAPVDRAGVERIIGALEACLAPVHDAGVVHRDVKPSNLLIGGSGTGGALLCDGEHLVLADFGLARRADASALTVAGGTDGYMAPEQRKVGAAVDQRADVFAASQMLRELIERAEGIGNTTGVSAVLDRGTSGDPDDRPGDIHIWAGEMRAALTANEVRVRSGSSASTAPPATARSRWPLVGVVALIVAALAVIIVSTVLREEPALPDGPQIIGPDELLVDDPGEWTHEDRLGLTYEWTLPSGETSTDLVIEWTPTEPEPFVIRLTASDPSTTVTSEMVVIVRTR